MLFDLDGTVYRGNKAIPGAAEFIRRLTIPFLFVTNRGNRTPLAVATQLRGMGIDCEINNVLTSAQAAAQYLGARTRIYCIGESGLEHALNEVGAEIVEAEDATPDAVLVSYDRNFDYLKLTRALRFIRAGARFVATNDDPLITTEAGLVPEAGPLVAAVATATGMTPEIVGKPYAPIMKAALLRLGIAAEDGVIVGDNLRTDILAGHNAGMRSALLLTGISTAEEARVSMHPPTWVAENYESLASQLGL